MSDVVHKRAPGVRTRPLPELECLLTFAPESRKLLWLNLNAWAIFELCDGARTRADIEAAYAEVFEGALSKEEVSGQVQAGLRSLESSGLIHAIKE